MTQAYDKIAGGWTAVAIDRGDNVAVALAELTGSATVHSSGHQFKVPLVELIPMGHKFSIRPIACGTAVTKYGQVIGRATADIAAGAHVHVQNLASDRAQARDRSTR
jgi:altronate dehydratase